MKLVSYRLVDKRWFEIQEKLRIEMGLKESFTSFESLKFLMNKLNRKKVKSEIEFEKRMRFFFRKNHTKYRILRNWPILNKFFGDYVLIRHKVVIEVDGSIHLTTKEKDKLRDDLMTQCGWKVFRVSYPGFNGLDQVFSYLDCLKVKPRKSKIKKDVHSKTNSMLVGCRVDNKLFAALDKKQRRLRAIRANYIKHGLDADKLLGKGVGV